jgi:sialic acid synthase SpsE
MKKPSKKIFIEKKEISKNSPTYFIAEIGSNFDGNLERAKDLIFLAKESGADAVKFQHYSAETLVSDYGFKKLGKAKSHQAKWEKSVYDTYQEASLNKNWTKTLKKACDQAGVAFITSPYSLELVDYVDVFVPAYKIGSGDITWPEIIEKIASKQKPIFLATGASNMNDVKRAAKIILRKNQKLIIMQCNTNYEAHQNNFSYLQLNVLKQYSEHYPGILLGLSDHTKGCVSVLGAVALGARVIEKHFTDSNKRKGPDHPFAMDPKSWREMVIRTRDLENALGDGKKKIEKNELATAIVQRRCVRIARKLEKGNRLTRRELVVLRPCPPKAIAPYEMPKILGKRLRRSLHAGEAVKWSDLTN